MRNWNYGSNGNIRFNILVYLIFLNVRPEVKSVKKPEVNITSNSIQTKEFVLNDVRDGFGT